MSYNKTPALGQATKANSLPVTVASDQDALEVSASSLPLPTGASTLAEQQTQSTSLLSIDVGVGDLTNALVTDGGEAAVNAFAIAGTDGTNPQYIKTDTDGNLQVDVLSSALPAGAATAAKQPALGTAGTASADVITVQGIASMTALKVDGSAVTQPVSAASLPLPTGAATSAKQDTVIGHLDGVEGLLTTIDADTGTLAGAVSAGHVQADIVGALPAGTNNIGDVDVLTVPAVATGKSTDFDTGAGTDNVASYGIAVPASGGAAIVPGDATNGLKVQVTTMPTVTTNATLSAETTKVIGTVNVAASQTIGLAAGNNNIGDVDIATMPNVTLAATTNTIEVVGDAAHDAAVAGNPVRIGAKAETSLSGVTLVADGDATDLHAGVDGVLITRPYCNLEDIVSGVDTDTAGDSTAVIAAQGAGIKVYVTSVIVNNSNASTDGYVDLRDGAAGTVKATIPAPKAGGSIVNFPVPIPFTANTAVCVDPSAAISTVTTTVIGFKSKV